MNLIQRTAALTALALSFTLIAAGPSSATARTRHDAARLVTGLGRGAGSTIGPDGALYVTKPLAGEIARIDRRTGAVTTFADGLPKMIPGFDAGGAMDVIFRNGTAYVLVTLVGSDVGGDDIVGIYRVNGPHSASVFADIGAFTIAHPSDSDFFVPSGAQYAIENARGGFLVTDGHHNRVLKVTDAGLISVVVAFGNTVPTGLEVRGNRVWVAQAGPIPHLPEAGRVLSFGVRNPDPLLVAAGGRLLVDVEFGPHNLLYSLAQGVWPPEGHEGSPASPRTGQLLRVRGGGFDVIATGLDQPTSMEIVGHTAYIVTLGGEVWTVNLPEKHHRRHQRS